MAPNRSEIPPKNKWNVEALYSNPAIWAQELGTVKGKGSAPRWPELKKFQGKLGNAG